MKIKKSILSLTIWWYNISGHKTQLDTSLNSTDHFWVTILFSTLSQFQIIVNQNIEINDYLYA